MNKSLSRAARGRQAGFTLVELLVVIAIIGMLVGLLLPAVQSMRQSAQNTQCLNQVRQMGLAMLNYYGSKQKYPGYVQELKRSNNEFVEIAGGTMSNATFGTTTDPDRSLVSWAAKILPELDRSDIYDVMVDATAPPAQLAIRPLEVFTCPSDTELTSQPDNAGLTYVVNTGSWDWYTPAGGYANSFTRAVYNALQPNGDTKANGVFHNHTFGSVNVRDLKDGSSTTLMFSENIHKEIEATSVGIYTWAGVSAGSPAEQQLGMVWIDTGNINPFVPPSGGGDPEQFPFSFEPNTAAFFANTPQIARPASNHAQGAFNCAMMDGSSKSIAADIDYDVYQRLLTPEGRKAVRPWDGMPAATFQNLPLLSETDF